MFNIKPHISEKTVNMSATNVFTMSIPFGYTKSKIAAVVREVFAVDPVSIRTMNTKPVISRKLKGFQKQKSYKKAIIKLADKQVIPGFQTFADEMKKSQDSGNKSSDDVKSTLKPSGKK
jgi:large subunit ribosomal protein L23